MQTSITENSFSEQTDLEVNNVNQQIEAEMFSQMQSLMYEYFTSEDINCTNANNPLQSLGSMDLTNEPADDAYDFDFVVVDYDRINGCP